MSLPYPFPFWVVAEQKKAMRSGGYHISLAILNLVELNLHPRPCSWYSLFLCWKGTLVSQPTNHVLYAHYDSDFFTKKNKQLDIAIEKKQVYC